MKRKILISLLVVSLFNYIGCYSYETISFTEFENELKADDVSKELFINTSDLKKYHCSKDFLEVHEDSIKVKGKIVIREDYEEPFTGKLAIKDIESIEISNLDALATILLVGSVAGCVAILIFLSSFAGSMDDVF